MILLFTLLVILIVIAIIVGIIALVGGAAFLTVFGDLIIFILIMTGIVKLIKKFRHQ